MIDRFHPLGVVVPDRFFYDGISTEGAFATSNRNREHRSKKYPIDVPDRAFSSIGSHGCPNERVGARTGARTNGVRSDDEETATTSLLEARVDVDVDVVERGDETRDANEAGERRGILRSTTTAIGRSISRSGVETRDERRETAIEGDIPQASIDSFIPLSKRCRDLIRRRRSR